MSQTHETDTCEVLVVRNLNVAFRQQDAPEVQAVRQLSFSLRRGETLAIVGESGSGKIGDRAGADASARRGQQRGEQRGAVVAAA